MAEEASVGVRMIASHLAQVKLEAAEKEYAARVHIRDLEDALDETACALEACQKDVDNYRNQIKQLQSESSYKALVSERDKWKSLIDTLRRDKKALAAEVERLKADQSEEGESADEVEDESRPLPPMGEPSGLCSPRSAFDAQDNQPETLGEEQSKPQRRRIESSRASEWIQLQGEVRFLRSQLEAKDLEINALRSKLDRELELKWEREHQVGGWQKSLLESFAEVLAPYPSSSAPPSPTAHKRASSPAPHTANSTSTCGSSDVDEPATDASPVVASEEF